MSNETLLAIPFFTFMGLILERSGMAEDLLDTIGQLFGPIRGGLAFAVIVVGALLAATTGVVAASVIAMGLISLPIMLRYGYDRRLATGAVGAMALAAMKGRLNWTIVRQALDSTTKLSAFVLFILIGSRVFSLTFFGVNGHVWVESLLTGLPGGQIGFLIVVNALVFVLAFFLDFFELAFIIVPLVGPAADHLGIDLIWFGVLLGINMQTAFMHPPFGFSLFYLRSVAPREPYKDRISGAKIAPITTGQIYWGAVPFVFIQVLMIALTIMFPSMVTRYKAGETAIDATKIQIQSPDFGASGPNFGTGNQPAG